MVTRMKRSPARGPLLLGVLFRPCARGLKLEMPEKGILSADAKKVP